MEIFKSLPRTVEEAIQQILSGWTPEERKSFAGLKPVDLFDLRNTLGADIRNVFSLWFGNDELLNASEKYLTENYEAYHQSFQLDINKENLDESIDNDFFREEDEDDISDEDDEEDEEDSVDGIDPLSIKMFPEGSFSKESVTPIDPYIASQVIIFAVWKYLQASHPTL